MAEGDALKGLVQSGWKQNSSDANDWSYIGNDGNAVKNSWQQDSGKNNWYYIGSDGKMATNAITPDGYKVGSDGSWDGGAKMNVLQNTSTANTIQQPVDNSGQISGMYDQQLSAAQAALKASIQASIGRYQDVIDKAPGQFQPLRDQASYAGSQNMQNLREMLANNGQQGGVNRTEETAVNSATEGNINKLNMQQQQVIDEANKAINDLKAQGDIQGAQLVAQNASEKIRALIDESNRVDTTKYNRSRDALADSRYNTEWNYKVGRDTVADNQWNQQFNLSKSNDDRNFNYQVSRDGVSDNHWDKEFDYNKANSDRNYALQAQAAARASSGSSSKQAKQNQTDEINSVYAELYNQIDNGYGEEFLQQNRNNIVNAYGSKVYDDMLKKVDKGSTKGYDAIRKRAQTEKNTSPY